MIIFRDIETRSAIDLSEVGAHVYAAHPSTEVLCVGYCIDNEAIKVWHPGEPVPKAFFSGETFVAHNAAFEMAIERAVLIPKYGFPSVPIEQQVCTMAQAVALALPGALEKLAKAANLKHQKDTAGERLMMKMSKPRKPKKDEDPNGIYYHDTPELRALLDNYCMDDVAAMREFYYAAPNLDAEEQNIWQFDQRVNDYGFYLDRELAEAARKIAAAMNPRINDELTQITNGQITAFTQVGRITEWVKNHIEIESLNKKVIAEALNLPMPPFVRRVLTLRLMGAQAAVAKVDALLQRRCKDGRVRGSFIYHAAGTGRWSSRGAQVHNLKRSMTKDLDRAIEIIGTGNVELALQKYENPLSVIGDCIRGMIIAKPGHILIGGDFSGIEARVTAWIAGDNLDVFRAFDAGTGPDPYVVTAAEIFDLDPVQLAKDYKDGKPEAREHRQVGKAAVLAFGYQGGVNAYRKFANDTQLSWDDIEAIKTKWRLAHPRIVTFWGALNRAISRAVENKKPDDPELVRHNCPIEVWCDEQPVLWIKLPNGRCLSYPKARMQYTIEPAPGVIRDGEPGDQEGVTFMDNASGAWKLTRMYGGLATENVVQAIARDLLAEAMLRIAAAGYKIVTHVHDEIVIEVPLKDAKRIEPIFTKLMREASPWADGLPIAVSSWINKRYTK